MRLDSLPVGLTGLYGYFLGMIRREVEQLGRLDVDGDDDERTPAWEGVGQRFLSVLAVARAALTLDQLVRFGGVRVWRQDAANVLDRMIPFLDRADGGWRLFHASLAEFLTTDGDVEPARWHRRIVRWYRAGTTRWADVDWTSVDDYGLLHLAEHLTELEQQRAEAADLVNPGLRLAARDRFGTDLPFRRIVDVALAEAARGPEVVEALARTLFLVLVRDGLRSGGGEVPPAVLGLLTRLGRFDEAVARAELLGAGEQQFRSFEAIRACATADERARLGGHDGVDRLVVAALEVSETESMFRGMERDRCLESAALLLAAHDPQRALRLVASADADYVNNGDSVRREASRHLPVQAALAMLAEVTGPRAIAALDLADRLPPCPEALAFAAAHLDSEERPGRIRALARLADTDAQWLAPLFAAADEAAAPRGGEDDRGPGFDEVRALADAAGILRARHPAAAERILATVSEIPADTSSDYGLKTAARLWAAWGEPARVTALIDALLAHYRGLGWYGPADDIAELALIVRDTDPDRAAALIDEAVALVTDVAAEDDPIDSSRLSNTLSQLVTHLKHWDLDLALRVAGRIQDGWIRGSSWDGASGRSNTLATIALPLVDTDRARAADILDTCLRLAEGAVRLGNPDPLVHHGGLFDVRDTPPLGGTATWWAANFITYLSNNVNYWVGGREYLPFRAPIEVLRSIQLGPADRAVSDSWAGVVASAVPAVTVADPDRGHDLVGWIVEPAQRLVAVAGLIDALAHLGDERLTSRLPAVPAAARAIPDYRPQIDLSVVSQAPILAYLDPGERARVEAALVVADPPLQITNLARELKSWYVAATHDLERLHRSLTYAPPGTYPADEIMNALTRYDEQYDPLQVDLVRCAAVRAMAVSDPGRARDLAEAIGEPWLAALARLHLVDETTDLAAACDDILAGVSSPARRAHVAAHAVQLVAMVDDKAAAELLNREAEAVRTEYPLIAALGLAALAWAAAPADAVPLIREALAKSADEANPYRRNPAIVELLPLAVHTADPALVAEVVRHLATGGWTTLMGGLVAAVPVLVRDMEPLVALDAAIRQAERALNPGEPEPSHIDGVAHPSDRGDAWLPGPPSSDYLSLFLEQDELPGMRMVQDSRDLGPDSSDDAFSSYGGVAAGMRIWMDEADRPVWRLVDVRWTFPDAERAAGYHEARLVANSEGATPVPGAPTVGAECHVFGMSVGVTAYYYLFRVGAVVVKLFVARGPQAARDLTPETVREIAGRVVRRVSASDLGLIDES